MKTVFVTLLVALNFTVSAQKVKLIEGSLSPLKNEKSIHVEFTYENMIVGKDKKESDYVAERKEELNAKEKGKGDSWEYKWFDDRKSRFEPQFRELFAKHSGMTTVSEKNTYTMLFKTTRTEPGWNVGVMRVPAYIDAEVWIVETANPSNVIAKIQVKKAPGRDAMGFDFETGVRLQESYAKAGKELGQLITKSLK